MERRTIFVISVLILLASSAFVGISQAQESIILQTVYAFKVQVSKNDTTQLLDIGAINGTISHFSSTDTGYTVKLFSDSGQTLFTGYTFISFVLITEPPLPTPLQVSSTVVQIRVPYYPNAKSIALFHLDKKILDIDLSKQVCNNNGVCGLGENVANCSHDCAAAQPNVPWLPIAIAVVVALVLVIYLIRKNYTIQV